MELHKETLRQAVDQLTSYIPKEDVWLGIEAGLKETQLQGAIEKLPVYEPDISVWASVEMRLPERKSPGKIGWFAAAAAVVALLLGLWQVQNRKTEQVFYTQERVDPRLLASSESLTDSHYEKVKAFCEAEGPVCKSSHFHQLREEFEELSRATRQLQQVMGPYNTEPELMRQFTALEREKTNLLNEMAKMI